MKNAVSKPTLSKKTITLTPKYSLTPKTVKTVPGQYAVKTPMKFSTKSLNQPKGSSKLA